MSLTVTYYIATCEKCGMKHAKKSLRRSMYLCDCGYRIVFKAIKRLSRHTKITPIEKAFKKMVKIGVSKDAARKALKMRKGSSILKKYGV